MKRSGFRYRKALVPYALLVLAMLGSTQAQPATAQTNGGQPDQNEIALHYSLYWENFKNGNYQDALPDLHWVLENAPGFPRGKDKNFERAVEAYEKMAEQTDDAAAKRTYLDSALVMYERAVPVLQSVGGEVDAFEWKRNKGRFIQNHLDVLDDKKGEAIQAYMEAYELDPMRLDPFYLDVILGNFYTTGDIGGTLDFLRELDEKRGEEEGVKNLVRKYFTVIPPEEQIAFLEKQREEDPDNVELIKQLFALYEQEGYHGEMMELAPRLIDMEPTPDILRLLVRLYIEDGEVEKSAELFKQLESMPGVVMTAQDYHNMGIAQQELGRYGSARDYYRQANQADPEYKQALKAIADLYATAVSTCGVSDRKTKGVFWLIADAYQRAGDASGAARFRAVFPSAEDIFYTNEWTEGGTTSVSYSCKGLTISGTTTVRKSN